MVPDSVKLGLAALIFVMLGLSRLAQRYPDSAWLRAFRWPQLSPEQKERAQRRHNAIAGAELILLGVALPIGFFLLTLMFFADFQIGWIIGIGAFSTLCIVLGIVAIVRNR